MKIALFDPYLLKFTGDIVNWLRTSGHEVRIDRYYDPQLVEWADIVWFETCDNNIKSATNPSEAIMLDANNYQPWDLHALDLVGKKVIVRPIDIEVWYGHQDGVLWDVVDEVIFIAPHIQELFRPEVKSTHLIPQWVDIERYNFREHQPSFNIAVVSEKWTSKGTDLILQVALKLKQIDSRYKIHWLGKWSDYEWEKAYFEDFIKHNELDFEFTEWIEGDDAVDNFLEDKDYLLHASHKEAFSMATAEAAAKGIRPILHRFYGADWLWGDSGWLWNSVDEAVAMITDGNYDSPAYRQYLIDKGYTVPQVMERIMEVIDG